MILTLRRRGLALNQSCGHGLEVRHVLASALSAFDILLELVGTAESAHKPRSTKSSLLLPKRFTFLPALLARSVRAVRALGIRTSKGKPRRPVVRARRGSGLTVILIPLWFNHA
jgi:hypothetical protein